MRYFISILIALIATSASTASCVVGNCTFGKGTYISVQGNKYVGQWHRGLRHGEGRLYYATGDYYVGQFAKGHFHGKGRFDYQSGDTYKGHWSAGKWHGQGEYLFANGDRYMGTFEAGAISGKGTYWHTDGSRYEGQWKLNKRHGSGTLYLPDGTYQVGQWDRGSLVGSEPASVLSTETIRDCNTGRCMSGRGQLDYSDGSKYVGDFSGGSPEGQGVCYYANGDVYRGGWSRHSPHGRGVMTIKASGKVYGAIWHYGTVKEQVFDDYSDLYTIDAPSDRAIEDPEVKIYALIVGVATYDHLQSLRYTDDDAYQLYAFLRSPEGGALPDEQIHLLIDDAASQQSIIRNVNEIVSKADANDVVLFYMSGHGFEGSFAPHDFDGYNNSLAYSDLLAAFDKGRARQKLFIADACHSGSMRDHRSASIGSSLANFYKQLTNAGSGSAIMMSSKSDEVSLEYSGMRQGVFSHFLIQGLKGKADQNHNKIVTIGELYDYIDEEVRTYTAQAQHPSMIGQYDRDMPIATVRE